MSDRMRITTALPVRLPTSKKGGVTSGSVASTDWMVAIAMWIDMSRPKVNDTYDGLAAEYGERSEVSVVSDDHAIFRKGPTQQVHVGCTLDTVLADIPDIEAGLAQEDNDIGVDVLIGEQPEVAQFHTGTSVVTITSLRTDAAA